MAKVAQGNLPNMGQKENHYRITEPKKRICLKVRFGSPEQRNKLRKLDAGVESLMNNMKKNNKTKLRQKLHEVKELVTLQSVMCPKCHPTSYSLQTTRCIMGTLHQ